MDYDTINSLYQVAGIAGTLVSFAGLIVSVVIASSLSKPHSTGAWFLVAAFAWNFLLDVFGRFANAVTQDLGLSLDQLNFILVFGYVLYGALLALGFIFFLTARKSAHAQEVSNVQ